MLLPNVEPLPEGWEMRLDDTTKTYYFINHNTCSTQWQHPVSRVVYRPTFAPVPQSNAPIGANSNVSKPIMVEREPVEQNSTVPESSQILSNSESRSDSPASSYTQIEAVMEKAKPLIEEVNNFKGSPTHKEYLRLMESIEVLIIQLDGIGVDGQEQVRNARRAAVKELQQTLEMLEFRASTDDPEPSSLQFTS